MQLALPVFGGLKDRIRLPDAVPPFGTRTYRLFSIFWLLAFLVALLGPIGGLYERYSAPGGNSALLLGSRVGIAVAEEDATRIRFTVGPVTPALGLKAGDDIVAVHGIPVPERVPFTEADYNRNIENPVYLALADLYYGVEDFDAELLIRSSDGTVRTVVVPTGEQHIAAAAADMGIPTGLLSYVDLVHVIFYPFLLWAAWILHRRNPRDAVSSILSLAILLTVSAENPSAASLAMAGVPRWLHVLIYDLGNICLLAGILLFPHGRLSRRLAILLASLPVLMLLHGDVYKGVFICFMLIAVYMLVRCLQRTPAGDLRQQIKWALYGFSSYAFFSAISLTSDMFKSAAGSFSYQILLEIAAGFSLGLAVLALQVGLLIALLRFRLYDAESIISRSASFAFVTLVLAGGFAGVMEGIIEGMQNKFGDSVGTGAAVMGAAMATVLIQPLHERVQKWAESRLHKNLMELREGLPQIVRDLREVADLNEFLHEVLVRVENGVRATRTACIIGRSVKEVSGISQAEVLRWLLAFQPKEGDNVLECNAEDPLFPIRVRLNCSSSEMFMGWLLVGPRPDGSLPGGDEREALIEIADPLARALRIVIKREKNEQELAAQLEAFANRIERLEKNLIPYSPPA